MYHCRICNMTFQHVSKVYSSNVMFSNIIHVCMFVRIFVCMHVCMHVYMHACMYDNVQLLILPIPSCFLLKDVSFTCFYTYLQLLIYVYILYYQFINLYTIYISVIHNNSLIRFQNWRKKHILHILIFERDLKMLILISFDIEDENVILAIYI